MAESKKYAVLTRWVRPSGDPGAPAQPVAPAGSGGGTPAPGSPPPGGGSARPMDLYAMTVAAGQAAGTPLGGPGTPVQPAPTGQPPAVPQATPAQFTPPAPQPAPQPAALPPDVQARIDGYERERQQFAAAYQRERDAADQLRARLGQQPTPTPAAPQVKRNEFGIPEWDRSLERFLEADANGVVTERAGAPPGTLARFNEFRHASREFQDRLYSDPAAALAPLLEKQKAEAREQAHLEYQQRQEVASANRFMHENQGWMFQQQNGQVVRDWQGNVQLTPNGQQFYEHVSQLKGMGITAPSQQIALATRLMLADVYVRSQGQQPQPPPPQQPAPQTQPFQGQVPQAPQFNPQAGASNMAPVPQHPPAPAMPLTGGPMTAEDVERMRQSFLTGQAAAMAQPQAPYTPPNTPAARPPMNGQGPSLEAYNQHFAPAFGLNLKDGWGR